MKLIPLSVQNKRISERMGLSVSNMAITHVSFNAAATGHKFFLTLLCSIKYVKKKETTFSETAAKLKASSQIYITGDL